MRKLVFLHPPKSGGTSLHDIIMQNYPDSALCPHRHYHLSNSDLDSYDLFSGHFYRQDIEDPRLAGAYRVIMLRNPVERTLSNYNFWRSFSDEHVQQAGLELLAKAKKASLSEYLDPDGPFAIVSGNDVARRVCRGAGLSDWRPSESSADEAISYIETFDFVVICEFMDLQLKPFCERMGWPAPASVPWRRDRERNHIEEPGYVEASKPAAYDDETRELAERVNATDMKIYDHFLKRFLDEQYREVALAYHDLRRETARSRGAAS